MNRSGNAAEASLAGVVEPAQAQVVHPPDLRLGSDGDVDADGVQIAEAVVQCDWDQGAIGKRGAGRHRDLLGGDCGGVVCGPIVLEASEREDTIGTTGVATEGGTVHVEAEATGEAMVAITDITRVAKFSGIGSSLPKTMESAYTLLSFIYAQE